jgi:hypothetical protein
VSDIAIILSEEEAFKVVEAGLKDTMISYNSRNEFRVTALSFDDEHSRMAIHLDRPKVEKEDVT